MTFRFGVRLIQDNGFTSLMVFTIETYHLFLSKNSKIIYNYGNSPPRMIQ